MKNGFLPKVGDRVKLLGNCHPRIKGIKALITERYSYKGVEHENILYVDPRTNELVISSGKCEGVEKLNLDEEFEFLQQLSEYPEYRRHCLEAIEELDKEHKGKLPLKFAHLIDFCNGN